MKDNQQLLIIGGVALVGLALFYLMARSGGVSTVPNGDGYAATMPTPLAADNATFAPGSFELQAPANSNTALTNPGSLVLFNFQPGSTVIDYPAPGTQSGGTSSGTSSPDGGTSGQCGCSSPACSQQGQATQTQFGGLAAWANMMAPFVKRLADALPSGGYGVFDPTAKTTWQLGSAVYKQQQGQMRQNAMWGQMDAIANWYGL